MAVELLTVRIVVPDGMSVPVTALAGDQSRRTTDTRDGRRSARQRAGENDGWDRGRRAWTAVAVRLWEPPAVAVAESVMLALKY